jgi:hypothetical protein
MLESIQPYLDKGETIYAGRLSYVMYLTGKNRVKLVGLQVYGVNQNKCVITWKNPVSLTEQAKEFPFNRPPRLGGYFTYLDMLEENPDIVTEVGSDSSFIDSLSAWGYVFDIDGLEEGEYDFSIVLFDPQGNSSIPTLASAYVYGQQYEASLLNREIQRITHVELPQEDGSTVSAAHIRWAPEGEGQLHGCNLEYDLAAGATARLYVPAADTATNLEGYKPGGECRYTSVYMPDGFSLDKFFAAEETVPLPAGS